MFVPFASTGSHCAVFRKEAAAGVIKSASLVVLWFGLHANKEGRQRYLFIMADSSVHGDRYTCGVRFPLMTIRSDRGRMAIYVCFFKVDE